MWLPVEKSHLVHFISFKILLNSLFSSQTCCSLVSPGWQGAIPEPSWTLVCISQSLDLCYFCSCPCTLLFQPQGVQAKTVVPRSKMTLLSYLCKNPTPSAFTFHPLECTESYISVFGGPWWTGRVRWEGTQVLHWLVWCSPGMSAAPGSCTLLNFVAFLSN